MEDPERMALMLANEPVGRMGNPEEIAETVVWLSESALIPPLVAHAVPMPGPRGLY